MKKKQREEEDEEQSESALSPKVMHMGNVFLHIWAFENGTSVDCNTDVKKFHKLTLKGFKE